MHDRIQVTLYYTANTPEMPHNIASRSDQIPHNKGRCSDVETVGIIELATRRSSEPNSRYTSKSRLLDLIQ